MFKKLRTAASRKPQPTADQSTGTDPNAVNVTLLEGFEWYAPSDGKHWKRLTRALPSLQTIGVDYLWLPPGCKAGWHGSNGYDLYDLYDLGEFEQKGHRATKWGGIEDLMALAQAASRTGVGLLWDAVLNHKSAADFVETCRAVVVDKNDRLKEISPEHDIDVWSGYNFGGRGGAYSQMKYRWQHFSGTDWEAKLQNNDSLYRFVGPNKPGWATDVDDSEGNADFLMGNDLDYSQPEVRDDVIYWGEWITQRLGLAGFRLDAVKHFSSDFLRAWIAHLDKTVNTTDSHGGKPLLMIGEYWRDDFLTLSAMIEKFNGRLRLFDVPLASNMSKLSIAKEKGDLRTILHSSLLRHYPEQAVPFVLNHDTQTRYERDHSVTAMEPWFIPLAYALVLLHANSHLPCVFYGDLYGISGEHPLPPSCAGTLPKMILARKLLAYGPKVEYFDQASCIGFTRHGLAERPGTGVAVVMGNAAEVGWKKMDVGRHHEGEVWTDILGQRAGEEVVIGRDGMGRFSCAPQSVSVWCWRDGPERRRVDELEFDSDIYNIALD